MLNHKQMLKQKAKKLKKLLRLNAFDASLSFLRHVMVAM
jgi:hypothetical protein